MDQYHWRRSDNAQKLTRFYSKLKNTRVQPGLTRHPYPRTWCRITTYGPNYQSSTSVSHAAIIVSLSQLHYSVVHEGHPGIVRAKGYYSQHTGGLVWIPKWKTSSNIAWPAKIVLKHTNHTNQLLYHTVQYRDPQKHGTSLDWTSADHLPQHPATNASSLQSLTMHLAIQKSFCLTTSPLGNWSHGWQKCLPDMAIQPSLSMTIAVSSYQTSSPTSWHREIFSNSEPPCIIRNKTAG